MKNLIKKIFFVSMIIGFTTFLGQESFSQEAEKIVAPPPKIITENISNPLGAAYAENTVKKAESFINSKNYGAAKQQLDSISQWISDAAENHAELFKALKKLENADIQANIERDLAIRFAVLRDKALFLRAQVYTAEGDKKSAVHNLVKVIISQPDSELGFKSHAMLKELGFTYGVESLPVKTDAIEPPSSN